MQKPTLLHNVSSLPRLNVGSQLTKYKSSLPDIKGTGVSSLKSSILQQGQLEPMPASKLSSLAKIGLADRNPLMTRSLASVQVQDKQSTSSAGYVLSSADEFINRVRDADINKRIMAKQLETSIQMRKFNISPADRADSLRAFTHLNVRSGGQGQTSHDERMVRRGGESTVNTPSVGQVADKEHSRHTQTEGAGSRAGAERVTRELKNIDPYDCWAGSKAEYLKNKRRFERPMVL